MDRHSRKSHVLLLSACETGIKENADRTMGEVQTPFITL